MSIPILSSIFGEKPQIADYMPVDLTQEQFDALMGDIQNFPQIAQIGDLFQNYMLGAYEKAIPGFKDILALGGSTTKQMLTDASGFLAGEIPKDVQESIQRSSAFQSLKSGILGSPMAGASTARQLGLTSLELVSQGANLAGQAGNAAQRWAALSGANLPEGMLITPMQRAQLDMQQNLIKRNIQQQKYNVEAAPDPIAKGLSDIVANLTAAYLGGKGGGAPSTYGSQQMGVGEVSDVSTPGHYVGGGGTYGGAGAGSSWDTGPIPEYNNAMPLPSGDFSTPSYQTPYYGPYGYSGTPPPIFSGNYDLYGSTSFPQSTTWM